MTNRVRNSQLKTRFKPRFFPAADLLLRGRRFAADFCLVRDGALPFFVLLLFEVRDRLLPVAEALVFFTGVFFEGIIKKTYKYKNR